MPVDLDAAEAFLATHARPLDRHRFAVLFRDASPGALLGALDGYANSGGGYGWGLEPDLRSSSSQPGGALHAFEALADLAPVIDFRSVRLCDWLADVSLDGGALPFAFPVTDPAGCAPFWVEADPAAPSLQITAVVAAEAHRVAKHDPTVVGHAWVDAATRWSLRAAAELGDDPFAMEVAFALRLVDLVNDRYPEESAAALESLAKHFTGDGRLPVPGGAEGETMHPLDSVGRAGGPVTDLLDEGILEADLDRLEAGQGEEGGWTVDFDSFSPAASLDWRGNRTVGALITLREHGRLR
ncbi:MAG: hypothetical protein Q7T55_05990 [Solirubrobacteraceae bacterium]|nr:hypothetical protein [Solirubrobacteraceae bacterium]